jgi:hypothetical protein
MDHLLLMHNCAPFRNQGAKSPRFFDDAQLRTIPQIGDSSDISKGGAAGITSYSPYHHARPGQG